MSLRDHLEAIYEQRGKLTPAIVVDVARPKDHPLHGRFDWNNDTAGEAWRRHQAQELIRSVRVTYREATEAEEESSVRAWQAVRQPTGHVYEPAKKVAEDPFMSQLVLRDMEREWKQLHRRYGRFAEFVALVRGDLGEAS